MSSQSPYEYLYKNYILNFSKLTHAHIHSLDQWIQRMANVYIESFIRENQPINKPELIFCFGWPSMGEYWCYYKWLRHEQSPRRAWHDWRGSQYIYCWTTVWCFAQITVILLDIDCPRSLYRYVRLWFRMRIVESLDCWIENATTW